MDGTDVFSSFSNRRPGYSNESSQRSNFYSDSRDGQDRSRLGAKGESYLSRSLSSSFSSHIGSSTDERDDRHGVYSAYDMTGRSPYGSVVNRRYSQSSLSSSSASWQQSSASLGHQVVKTFRESGTLLSSLPDESREAHNSFYSPQPESRDSLDISSYHDNSDMLYSGTSSQRERQEQSSFNSRLTIHLSGKKSAHHVRETLNGENISPVYGVRSVVGVGQVVAEPAQGTVVTLRKQDERQLNGVPSVRDLAKRFSGNYSSLEVLQDGHGIEDMRRVKAETWPKYVYVQTTSDQYNGDEDTDVPPKPPYPEDSTGGTPPKPPLLLHSDVGAPPKPPLPLSTPERVHPITVTKPTPHTKVELISRKISDSRESKSNSELPGRGKSEQYYVVNSRDPSSNTGFKNSDNAVSHRLSLQELIKLHEEHIASHAKSALATSHLQIRLKRPSFECGAQWQESERSYDSLDRDQAKELVYQYMEKSESLERTVEQQESIAQFEKAVSSNESRKYVARYELTELMSERGTPIKIVELTNESNETHTFSERCEIKEKPAGRVKRHRTIGVVGFRQQIDRTAEENAKTKPKRHTTIGIVSVKSVSKEKPIVGPDYILHNGGGLLEALPSAVELKSNEESSESEDSVFVEPSTVPEEVCRMQAEFHEGAEAEEEHPKILGVSSRDVVSDRPDGEQTREPTVATLVELTEEVKASPVLDVEVKVSEPAYYNHSSQLRPSSTKRSYHYTKTVPIAQVSPVSPPPTGEERKTAPAASPLPESHSARAMYETRLALWNLIPSASAHEAPIKETPDAVRSASSAKRTPELAVTRVPEDGTQDEASPIHRDVTFHAQKEEFYLKIIEKLKKERQETIEMFESDKRELWLKYEEQKKVANAYQKLEDRYRRRVHELQEALANCTCHNSLVVTENTPHILNKK